MQQKSIFLKEELSICKMFLVPACLLWPSVVMFAVMIKSLSLIAAYIIAASVIFIAPYLQVKSDKDKVCAENDSYTR